MPNSKRRGILYLIFSCKMKQIINSSVNSEKKSIVNRETKIVSQNNRMIKTRKKGNVPAYTH
jgi:hypothetical protein